MKASDKDKMAENPGLMAYPHHIGSIVVKPEDVGKIKSRALSAMEEQTHRQLQQIQKQAELLAEQANAIKKRVDVSYKIYSAKMPFEPFIGSVYHLYEQVGEYKLMMVGPHQWGLSKKDSLHFVNSVTLLSEEKSWKQSNCRPPNGKITCCDFSANGCCLFFFAFQKIFPQ